MGKVIDFDAIRKAHRANAAKATTSELKAVWDAWDGGGWDTEISPEDAYLELNRRGEGSYCAI